MFKYYIIYQNVWSLWMNPELLIKWVNVEEGLAAHVNPARLISKALEPFGGSESGSTEQT